MQVPVLRWWLWARRKELTPPSRPSARQRRVQRWFERHDAFCVRCFEQLGLRRDSRCFHCLWLNFNLWSGPGYWSIVCYRGFDGWHFDGRLCRNGRFYRLRRRFSVSDGCFNDRGFSCRCFGNRRLLRRLCIRVGCGIVGTFGLLMRIGFGRSTDHAAGGRPADRSALPSSSLPFSSEPSITLPLASR